MKDIHSGLIVWLVAAVAFISSLSITPFAAEAAPAHDEFAASTDSGKLPPCPSMFKCRIE